METIKIVSARVGEELKVEEIENTLEAKQKFVDGYIQIIDVKAGNGYVDLVLNEEGKMVGLPENFYMFYDGRVVDVAVGDVFFSAFDEHGEAISLTDEEINNIYNLFPNRNTMIFE